MQTVTVAAGIFCLICWGFTAWEVQQHTNLSARVGISAAKPAGAPLPEPPAVAENSRFVLFAEQPLFRPDRQPLDWALLNNTAADIQQTALTAIEKRYQLTGVSISKPEKAALILDTQSNQTMTLGINETLSGWSLQRIDKHSVTFTHQARELQLLLLPAEAGQQNPASKPRKATSRVPDDDPFP